MTVRVTRRRAALAVELAIVLPFISFLFLIAVDFCRVFYCTQTVQACAECGALYASGTAPSQPDVSPEQAARQAVLVEGASLHPPLQAEDIQVVTANGHATVTVTYPFQPFASYPCLPRRITLVRSVQMRVAPKPGT